MNNFQQLHAACSAHLRRLPLPVPFDLDEFCLRISAERGRPLEVRPWRTAMPAGTTGSCMPYGDRDVIYHQPWATGLHRTQIVLHEIAHLVCAHVAHDKLSSHFEMVQPGIHARMFARHDNYDDEEEREAEMLASLMMEHAITHTPSTDDPLVARLHAALAPAKRRRRRG